MPYAFTLRGGLVVALFVLASLLVPAKALAQEGCLTDVGKRTPVLFVHGLNSEQDMWEPLNPKSLYSTLKSDQRLLPALFDYSRENTRWVDYENLGGRLANEIACRAESSRAAGGPGKVIVVAHSMGGLATRYAASQVINGRKVADHLGLVITIGTPNRGSLGANVVDTWLKDLCTPRIGTSPACGSPEAILGLRLKSNELERLPEFPGNTPVLAIAGDVSLLVTLFLITVPVHTSSDLVVGVDSATVGAAHKESGGGKRIVPCTDPFVPLTPFKPSCWHNNLPSDKTIKKLVLGGIKKYLLASAPAPCLTRKAFQDTANRLYFEDYRGEDFMGYEVTGDVACQEGWAAARVKMNYFGGRSEDAVVVLRQENGRWMFAEGERADVCRQAPLKIQNVYGC